MLGQPIYMLIPEVIGFRLKGKLPEGTTATDLVLTVTQMLRKKGVVDKFVEFFGDGLAGMSVPDRATIANMAPEYGATMGFFPVDQATLDYLRFTGRSDESVALVEAYCKANGLLWTPSSAEPEFTDVLELDLSPPCSPPWPAPSRPQDRVELMNVKSEFLKGLGRPSLGNAVNIGRPTRRMVRASTTAPPSTPGRRPVSLHGPSSTATSSSPPSPVAPTPATPTSSSPPASSPARPARWASRASPGSRPASPPAPRSSPTTSTRPASPKTSTPWASTPSATAAPPASATPAPCPKRSKPPSRKATSSPRACSRATATSRAASTRSSRPTTSPARPSSSPTPSPAPSPSTSPPSPSRPPRTASPSS